MRVRRLVLADIRSYEQADLMFAPGITAFVGHNGAGKTNLLEAMHIAARGDSPRAGEDPEIVRWGANVGRVNLVVEQAEAERTVEIVLFAPAAGERRRPRRYLLDGAGKRADDVIGELKVVAFFPEDVDLLAAAPGARRRYLDAMLAQVDRRHRADTREYQRVVEQRNALLRSLRDEQGTPAELAFWDAELCRLGAAISVRRSRVVDQIRAPFERAISLFAGGEGLELAYAAQVPGDGEVERAAAYAALLAEKREREIWQGATLVGPHREDLLVTGGGRQMPAYASRGEQRSAVLALKIAEASWVHEHSGDVPVFLLDDVLSELDPRRRDVLVATLPADAQAFITAASEAALPAELSRHARVLRVTPGEVA